MTKHEEMQRLKAWWKNLKDILVDLEGSLLTAKTPIIARSHRVSIKYYEGKLKEVEQLISKVNLSA